MKFAVVDIGCIHCSAPSGIVGVFTTKEEADAIAEVCAERLQWMGEALHHFEVMALPEALDIVAEKYAAPTAAPSRV